MAVAGTYANGVAEDPVSLARPPSQAVLRTLSVDSAAQLDRVLSQRYDYIDHPSFDKPGIGKKLFADEFDLAGSLRPWCNTSSAPDAPHAGGAMTPQLKGDEERQLFLKFNYGRYRIAKILSKFAGKRLTAKATKEILWWQARVEKTRCEIVQANIPLVLAMAKRTRLGNIDYAELISEGNMALLRSVDKFDTGRGFKFSTYACRAILKSFSRVAMKIGRYRGRFPVEFDPSLERSDFLDLKRQGQEEDCVSELRGIIQNNSASLNEVEIKVIQARFALCKVEGLEGDGPKTLEQVGNLIGVTKERVRQIQNRALAKLRGKLHDDFLAA